MNNIGWSSNSGGGSTEGYTHPATHPATMIDVNTANFPDKKLNIVLEELFTSGSNGKNNIETTIISKGGSVSKVGSIATFAELLTGINSIPAPTLKVASGKYNLAYTVQEKQNVVVRGLTFKPKMVFTHFFDSYTRTIFLSVYIGKELSGDAEDLSAGSHGSTLQSTACTLYNNGFDILVPYGNNRPYWWIALG